MHTFLKLGHRTLSLDGFIKFACLTLAGSLLPTAITNPQWVNIAATTPVSDFLAIALR